MPEEEAHSMLSMLEEQIRLSHIQASTRTCWSGCGRWLRTIWRPWS